MENQSLFELQIDGESSSFLSETARWGKFLAVVGFIFCGLMAFIAMLMATGGGPFAMYGAMYGNYATTMRTTVAFIYIVMSFISFFPYLFLFQFSGRMQRALRTADQYSLVEAFSSLKSTFKFVGILTIIMLSFIAIAFLFGLVAGLSNLG